MVERGSGCLLVGLLEGVAQAGGDHGLLSARHISERVAGPMNPAPLPGRLQDAAYGGFKPLVRVRDDKLHHLTARA